MINISSDRILIQNTLGEIKFDTNWKMTRFFIQGSGNVSFSAVNAVSGVFNEDYLLVDTGYTMAFVTGYMLYGSTFYPINGGSIPIFVYSGSPMAFPIVLANFSIYMSGTQVRIRRQIYKTGLAGLDAFSANIIFYAGNYDL